MSNEPYCSHCNYNLTGLTESSKCPECGKPLVEVLTREAFDPKVLAWSRHYTSKIRLFGLPLIHVALGPSEHGRRGRAKGIIAVGDQAIGFLAIGGLAMGLVAIGGLGIGLFGVGGCAIGVFALGGWAMGGFVGGGGTLGLLAVGGGAIGVIACGGGVIGYYAAGGGGYAKYLLTSYRRDPEAVELFGQLTWLLGSGAPSGMLRTTGWLALVLFCLLLAIGIMAGYAYLRHRE